MYALIAAAVGLIAGILITYLVMRARITAVAAEARAAVADELSETKAGAAAKVAELTATLDAERRQTDEKVQLLSDKFRSIANEIFEQQTQRFTEQNQSNLDLILGPLKEKIADFQAKVETVYVNESKDRSALHEQVSQLMQLNQMLSEDAKNYASFDRLCQNARQLG